MAKNVLSLNLPDLLNTCIMRIEDTSLYNPLVPVSCSVLQITPPGFNLPIQITNRAPGFIANISACDLGIQQSNCDNWNNALVDGLYIVNWSISPNTVVFVEYNHLRIANIMNIYMKVLCQLDISNCLPTIEVQEKIKELQLIKTLIDAAKANVEIAGKPQAGMAIYNYARQQLNKIARIYSLSC